MRLLLVEDDAMLGHSLKVGLERSGHTVEWVQDGEAALLAIDTSQFDLMLLDINLPRLSGMEVVKKLRQASSKLPVLMLTAMDGLEYKVKGLDSGADDYLTKPFNEREFTARIRTILRRNQPGTQPTETELVMGDLRLSPHSHVVLYKGKPLELTLREFDILRVLLSHPGKALTREEIVRYAWGPNTYLVPRVVDVHLGHLRAKLGPMGRKIETIPQVGYRIVP